MHLNNRAKNNYFLHWMFLFKSRKMLSLTYVIYSAHIYVEILSKKY
jgi:hypothetical protein